MPQGATGSVLWIALMVALMYFLLIRPQKKQQKEREAMLSSVRKGDRVITIGGIHGIVRGIKEDRVTLEIASEVFVHFSKSAVASIVRSDKGGKAEVVEDVEDFEAAGDDEVQDADYVIDKE